MTLISVEDTGSGISPEVMRRIFDPFFSTKAIGSSMGLGLAICQRLVSNMGGSISVASAAGRGSIFFITLPNRQLENATRASTPRKLEPVERRASVLMIDDEVMMCDLLRNMLRDDYEVTTSSSSRAALESAGRRHIRSRVVRFDDARADGHGSMR